MENKINIAKLLKDCLQGMELDCMMFEDIEFDSIVDDEYCPIRCRIKNSHNEYDFYTFTKHGYWNNTYKAKCVIFPKGKTTQEGFHRPFKNGDIVISTLGSIAIVSNANNSELYNTYCALYKDGGFIIGNTCICIERFATEEERAKLFQTIKDNGYKWNPETKTLEKLPIFNDGDIIYNRFHKVIGIYHSREDESPCVSHCRYNEFHKTFEILKDDLHIDKQDYRLASDEEKQKFFDAIKAHGYKWNAKTKTLKKLPKFKVGDRIKSIYNGFQYDIKELTDTHYTLVEVEDKFKYTEPIIEDKNWELVPYKFDINTLVPFEDKVLVRNDESQRWLPAFWGYKVVDGFITTFGWCKYCIPYKGNEILFKTNDDCDDYFKTWEK